MDRPQRQFKRYAIDAVARVEPLNQNNDDAPPIAVRIRDIGLTGMMLLTDQPFKPASAWRLCLLDSQAIITTVPIVVRYCAPVDDGGYRVGVQIMLEPFFLTWLGVDRREICRDEIAHEDRFIDAS